MKEIFRDKRGAAVLFTVALGLGTSACGGSGSAAPERTKASSAPSTSGIKVHAQYFPDGTRLLKYAGVETDSLYPSTPVDVFEFCDGHDLFEETVSTYGKFGDTPDSITRSVNYPACADGRLTPSDFPQGLTSQ